MKPSARLSRIPGRYLLAFGAGLLQAASFPNLGLFWQAWLAPGLILLLALDRPRAFRLGYCAGLGHYGLSLYWLLLMPLPVKAVLAWLAVSAILSLYTGAWTWFCCRTFPLATIAGAPASWPRRSFWALTCASAWVAMEMGIARIATGFPWNLLGVSQYKMLPLIQIASVTGVYGVSFLIVWLSTSLAVAAFGVRPPKAFGAGAFPGVESSKWAEPAPKSKAPEDWRTPKRFSAVLCDLALPPAGLLAVLGFGLNRLAQPEPAGRTLKVALVQPSIPQTVIWDPKEATNRFHKLVALSHQALATQPDLLVWPEAALPDLLTRFNPLTHDAVTNLVLPNHLWMILGADDARPKKNAVNPDDVAFFNAGFLVAPNGELVATYFKRHLVMFGEYLPFARWLPFLKKFRATEGGFTPGDSPVPFVLSEPNATISVLICFEDVFPHLVRGSVEPDTDFLLNLTNNGWFGESAAQWQHAVSALFRAVENGLPLVRCTNNGLTCWIDARGRLHDQYFPGSWNIYGAGFKLGRVPLHEKSQAHPLTFYHRHGDWFGWGCVVLTGAALLQGLLHRPRRSLAVNPSG